MLFKVIFFLFSSIFSLVGWFMVKRKVLHPAMGTFLFLVSCGTLIQLYFYKELDAIAHFAGISQSGLLIVYVSIPLLFMFFLSLYIRTIILSRQVLELNRLLSLEKANSDSLHDVFGKNSPAKDC
jgi:hypothetical protein